MSAPAPPRAPEPEPEFESEASHTYVLTARRPGRVAALDNRRLAAIAKLAGAPRCSAMALSR